LFESFLADKACEVMGLFSVASRMIVLPFLADKADGSRSLISVANCSFCRFLLTRPVKGKPFLGD
jgi:hypothetical protein